RLAGLSAPKVPVSKTLSYPSRRAACIRFPAEISGEFRFRGCKLLLFCDRNHCRPTFHDPLRTLSRSLFPSLAIWYGPCWHPNFAQICLVGVAQKALPMPSASVPAPAAVPNPAEKLLLLSVGFM